MSVPRVVVEFAIEGETIAYAEHVRTSDDAWRLQAEMCRRETLDEDAGRRARALRRTRRTRAGRVVMSETLRSVLVSLEDGADRNEIALRLIAIEWEVFGKGLRSARRDRLRPAAARRW